MRCSRGIHLVLSVGLTLSVFTALPSCAPARAGGSPLARGLAPASETDIGVAASVPRRIIAPAETLNYTWSAYHHLAVSNALGGYLYDFIAGPTSKAVIPPGNPTVDVELHRSMITPRIIYGGGYVRGTWPVPATRRVRGTTQTFSVEGVEMLFPVTYQGGLVVYTDPSRDIVFVEPTLGRPADSAVEVQVLTPSGLPQTVITVAPGFYHILTTNSAGTSTLISDPFPWNSIGQEVSHNPYARAALDSIRAAAISSGLASMKDLPPLTGP